MSYDDFLMKAILTVFLLFITLLLVAVIYTGIVGEKGCAVYSELRTKTGVIMAGKVAVPTTYQGRDCLVYEEE